MDTSLDAHSADAPPEAVVRAAVAALEAERWADVVPLVAPAALAQFRSSRVAALIELARRVPRTPEQIEAEHPGLSPEAVKHHADQERIWSERGTPALLHEWGVKDIRELDALSDAELLTRFLAASSPAARLRASWAVGDTPLNAPAPDAAEHLPRLRWRVLESVIENDHHAHVSFRQFWHNDGGAQGSEEFGRVRVTTLDRTPMGWRLRIDSSLLAQQYGISVHHAAGGGETSPTRDQACR
jgi:hypothetical protein